MKTKTIIVSYEISCSNEKEVESARRIIAWEGGCGYMSCSNCPFSTGVGCVEDDPKQRLIIAKAMLGVE